MSDLLAYTKGISKKDFVKEMQLHKRADNFIKGTYDKGKKGCAVGCALKSVAKLKKIELEFNAHREFETHLGIPTWLAKVEDTIFEGVSVERSKVWPVEFAKAINEGADLNKVKIPFLIYVVESARKSATSERSIAAIDGVLTELKRPVLDKAKLEVARRNAYAAADAATAAAAATAYAAAYAAADAATAADAAAYAATAYAAAYAATAADAAADAAAYAADAAADAAAATAYAAAYAADAAADAATAADAAVWRSARAVKFGEFADELLRLLKECK